MKKILIRVSVLAVVFVAAVLVFSFLTGKQNAEMTADMGDASLPRISFQTNGYEVNSLAGYTEEMDITAMRDTITPLDANGNLKMMIKKNQKKVKKFAYTIYSLNAQRTLAQGKGKFSESEALLTLTSAFAEDQEGVLVLTLYPAEGREIYYYTRLTPAYDYHVKECLDFVKEFHEDALAKNAEGRIASFLEPDEEGDNGTLQHVTIHCKTDQVMWGAFAPEAVGNVSWDIVEGTASYTSVLLKYKVKSAGENSLYSVREYFRVRAYRDKLYLLDYDRTMEEIQDAAGEHIAADGIDLGVVPEDISYMANEDGTVASFIQAGELWNYNQKEDKLSRVFSFRSDENNDVRNEYDQHQIKIISVEKNGSTAFAVYGYMNRGLHEGKVGAAIYYYNIEKNFVEEKAFIPSRQSFAIAEDELGKLIYYNHEQELLYVMLDGALYRIYLEDNGKEVLVDGLRKNQYAASKDGHLIAYQTGGSYAEAKEIKVMNLNTGKDYTVQASEGEAVIPLGFIYSDFVYGTARKEDKGKTVTGAEIVPMYKLEIRSDADKVLKTYQMDGIHILDIFIEDNLLTINRVARSGEIYTSIAKDYITGNQGIEDDHVVRETYSTEEKQRQVHLKFAKRTKEKNPKLLKPKQVLFENPVTVSLDAGVTSGNYYVYGCGELLGVYDRAGYAVVKADEETGVVVDSRQSYVWEKGNRDLVYQTDEFPVLAARSGETTLAACVRMLTEYEGNPIDAAKEMDDGKSAARILTDYTKGTGIDLTGATVEQMLYIIGKGTPVIAMTDSVNAVLLIGYTQDTVTYVNPADGSVSTVPREQVEAMAAGSGNTFIGYVK